MVKLLKAQIAYLHRRERSLLKRAKKSGSDLVVIERSANRTRKQAREAIFLA